MTITSLRTREERLISAGLCTCCGKNPPLEGRRYCPTCANKRKTAHMVRYYDRLSQGLCPHCGGKRDDHYNIGCNACNKRIADARTRNYKTEKHSHYQRRLHSRRRRQGMCPTCGQRLDDPKYKSCSTCRAKAAEYREQNADHILPWKRQYYKKTFRPKKACKVCRQHRVQCPECKQFMKATHGDKTCIYICKCGVIEVFKKGVKKL